MTVFKDIGFLQFSKFSHQLLVRIIELHVVLRKFETVEFFPNLCLSNNLFLDEQEWTSTSQLAMKSPYMRVKSHETWQVQVITKRMCNFNELQGDSRLESVLATKWFANHRACDYSLLYDLIQKTMKFIMHCNGQIMHRCS